MLRYPLLVLALTSLLGCGPKPLPKPQVLTKFTDICPSWKDATKGHKAQIADELDAAPASAVWPDVLVADQALKDQLTAAGCKPVK